jgi:hypothetical protein
MDYRKYRKIPAPKRTEDRYGYLHRVGVFFRRLLPFLLLALALALMTSVVLSLRSTLWCYYTDDLGVRREAEDPHVRFILWSYPETPSGDWRLAGVTNGVKFHPDDGRMFVSMLAVDTNHIEFLRVAESNRVAKARKAEADRVAAAAAAAAQAANTNRVADTNAVATVQAADTDRVAESDAVYTNAIRADADLFASEWNGKRWSSPKPLDAFNTTAGEYELVESRDGRWRFFTSDRTTGGVGGVDIWVAGWDGKTWVGVTNLVGANSPANEMGLTLTPDGHTLYFASDRPTDPRAGTRARGGFDIYRATLEEQTVVISPSNKVSLPVVTAIELVSAVSSGADEMQPELSPRADTLYFASNRKGGLGGYDIYAARIVRGQVQTPENLGVEINTADDEVGPAVRMEGFDLMFRSNRRQADKSVFPLYSATCREVITTVDLSRLDTYLQLLNRIKWWALILVAAISALIYLIKRYRELTDQFHKCLMASLIAHVAVLVVIAAFTISKKVVEALKEPETVEVMVDPRTMQELKKRMESMAVDKSQTVAKIAAAATMAQVQDRGGAPMPETSPTIEGDGPVIVAKSSDQTFVTKIAPSAASPLQTERMQKLKNLADVRLASVTDVVMEESSSAGGQGDVTVRVEGGTQRGERESDSLVKAAAVQQTVTSEFVKNNDMPVSPVGEAATVEDVVPAGAPGPKISVARSAFAATTRDTGGEMLVASAGCDGPTRVPHMDGKGSVLGTVKGGISAGDLKLPGELDVPAGFMDKNPADLVHWVGRPSPEVVEALGGSSATEGAIKGSLEWFSKTQEQDGRWDCKKHGGEDGHDIAATSLALLCYFGWGMKHNDTCDYQKQVKAALDWMVKTIKSDGDLRNGNTRNGMYDQGIGTIALCEAYGVTHDPALYEPASNAVTFVVKAQGKEGGWRYAPGGGGDLSVFGWQFMALHSAKLAKVPFDEACMVKASNWIDSVSAGANGGFYGYDGPTTTGDRPSMMAVGMFCRQLQKFAPGHDRMKETATWLRTRHLGGGGGMDTYYLYYTTLALYQHQGEVWEEWNKRMKEIVPPLQIKTGDDAGSWNPSGQHGGAMGRAVMTGMATLSLEVYYRYLPMYGYREKDE